RVPAAPGDLTSVLGWSGGPGQPLVIAGISSYELPSLTAALATPSVVAYAPGKGAMTPLVPGDRASVGPLALADYDGDGDLDLFVGSRIFPGGYPLPPSSRLFRNEAGRLIEDTANTALLAGVGMVSAAVFSDINGDGWPDLILAIEWGT